MGADETATRGTDESVPYDAIFVPAKHYNGTGKPVPYKVRCKTQQRTCVTRNVMVSANVPNRATRDMRIRRCSNSQLKSDGNVRSGGGNVSKIDGFRAKSAVE